MYIAKREIMTGIGGVWGNRIKLVNHAICKDCGEIARTEGQIAFDKDVARWNRRFLKIFLFFFAFLMIAGTIDFIVSWLRA